MNTAEKRLPTVSLTSRNRKIGTYDPARQLLQVIGAFLMVIFLETSGVYAAEGQDTRDLAANAVLLQRQLDQALSELAAVQQQAADRNIPLSEEISRLDQELLKERDKLDKVREKMDSRNLQLNNLRTRVKARKQEKQYLSNLLGEYIRNLETQVHIVQLHEYGPMIKSAKLALENESMTAGELFSVQIDLLDKSTDRLLGLIGGDQFAGQAAKNEGTLVDGQYVLLGPLAFFASRDGETAGLAVERLGSLQPNVVDFETELATSAEPMDIAGLLNTISTGEGALPIDATLGKAHKLAATSETLREHMSKGGVVMYPIIGLLVLSVLVSLIKWIQLMRIPVPGKKPLKTFLNALLGNSKKDVISAVAQLHGPIGSMLESVAENFGESRDLIEEVMFEKILETRMRLNKGLSFLAVCASSAPLLGLLGTVTGIISTFKLITAFGAGDVKMLSAGISEALVTTEFGLIVAIPSLLFHAFLSRRSKSLVDTMERIAVSALNQLAKRESPMATNRHHPPGPLPPVEDAPAGGKLVPETAV